MGRARTTRSTREVGEEAEAILARARREPRYWAARERDALIDAVRYGRSDLALALLARGAEPDTPDPNGRTALWWAAHWGRGAVIRDLVRRGARLPDDVLMGPVHDADLPTIRFLIRRGADVNCAARFTRYSPRAPEEVLLTVAVFKAGLLGYPEAVAVTLVRAGAEVDRLAFPDLPESGIGRGLLGLAAQGGHAGIVRAMLAAGADVDFRDTWSGTALIDAAGEGHRTVVRMLLRAGARADVRRRDGHTAASFARAQGFAALADELERAQKGR